MEKTGLETSFSILKEILESHASTVERYKSELETRLKEILESHASTVERYKSERDGLRNRAMFCREHKFEEEQRITLIKLEQMEMLFYEYESMFNDVNEALMTK